MPFNKPLEFPFLNDRIWVEIIDPEFYFDSEKIMAIPRVRFMIQAETVVQINIKAEYYEMLDRPSKPCNSSSEYIFTKCVKVKYSINLRILYWLQKKVKYPLNRIT